MGTIKDGGAAFPQNASNSNFLHGGMTLRDYFVAHASAADINDMVPNTVGGCARYLGMDEADYRGEIDYVRVLAKARHVWADAMLAEREKK